MESELQTGHKDTGRKVPAAVQLISLSRITPHTHKHTHRHSYTAAETLMNRSHTATWFIQINREWVTNEIIWWLQTYIKITLYTENWIYTESCKSLWYRSKNLYFTFTFSHLADAFIQSDLQMMTIEEIMTLRH